MFTKLLEKLQDYIITKKLKSKGYDVFIAKQQLNPYCNISAQYQGREFFNQPFSLILNTYLKDYGFDPETKKDGTLKISIVFGGEEYFLFPLYVKKDGSNFGLPLTVTEAVKAGYIIPPRRVEAK